MSVAHPLKRSWAYLDQHSGLMASCVFVLSLMVYIPTLAPGLLWGGGDFAAFQTRVLTGEGIRGGIFGHSLWIILSRPFIWLPIRDVAYRANLASAVYAAAALAFVFLSARRLTRAAAPALLGTAALLVSHTFWTYAVMPKVYSLNALLLALCVYCLLRWGDQRRALYLYLFAVIYALSLMNHLVMATAALGFGVYIALIARRNFDRAMLTQVCVGAALFVLGLVPYFLISESSGDTGDTVLTIGSFLGGLAQLITQPASLLLGLGIGAALLLYQFPLSFVAGLIGLRAIGRQDRSAAWLLLLIAAGDVAFMLAAIDPRIGGEYVWNLHYYLQLYVIYSLWIAIGLKDLWPHVTLSRLRQTLTVLAVVAAPIVLYLLTPIVVRPFLSNIPAFRELRGRDNITYVLSPWKQDETGPMEFTNAAFAALPYGSTLFADYSLYSMFNYRQVVDHMRPDVKLIDLSVPGEQLPLLLARQDQGYLYLADTNRYYAIDVFKQYFDIVPEGPLYRLIPKP